MKQTLKIIAVSALATAALIKTVPAFADTPPAQEVTIVHTADLDLTTKAGRGALERRLVSAAYEVCGTASDADLAGKNKARSCRREVLVKARAESGQLASRTGPIFVAAAR